MHRIPCSTVRTLALAPTVASLMLFGCEKTPEVGGSPSSDQAPTNLIPEHFRGAYRDGGSTLSVTATGLAAIRIPYKDAGHTIEGSMTISEGQEAGTNSFTVKASTYTGYADDGRAGCAGSPARCAGSIELAGDRLAVALTGSDGCAELLSGNWTKVAANPAPVAANPAPVAALSPADPNAPLPPDPVPERWSALTARLAGGWSVSKAELKEGEDSEFAEEALSCRLRIYVTDPQMVTGIIRWVDGTCWRCIGSAFESDGSPFSLLDFVADEASISYRYGDRRTVRIKLSADGKSFSTKSDNYHVRHCVMEKVD